MASQNFYAALPLLKQIASAAFTRRGEVLTGCSFYAAQPGFVQSQLLRGAAQFKQIASAAFTRCSHYFVRPRLLRGEATTSSGRGFYAAQPPFRLAVARLRTTWCSLSLDWSWLRTALGPIANILRTEKLAHLPLAGFGVSGRAVPRVSTLIILVPGRPVDRPGLLGQGSSGPSVISATMLISRMPSKFPSSGRLA